MPKTASNTPLSRKTVFTRLIWLVVLALVVGVIAYPPPANWTIDKLNGALGLNVPHIEKGFVLGLDLQGGTELEYEADVSNVADADRPSAVQGVRDVIERRVNTLGVSEPNVTTSQAGSSWRVSVELAGIRDVNQAINLIGATPILEFKEQADQPTTTPTLTPDLQKKMDDANAAALKKAQDALAAALKAPQSWSDLVKADSMDQASQALGGDLGWLQAQPDYSDLYNAVKGYASGTIANQVIETSNAYIVAKVTDTKPAGIEIEASHILISYQGATDAPANALTKDAAKAKAEQLRTQVTTANFAAMAKQNSDEPGAAQTGGSLGWFGKGVMVPEFETAAFALKDGQISDVVETPFGFHIIWRQASRPLNDVRVSAIIEPKLQASDMLPPPSPWKDTELTGKQLTSATLVFDQRTGNAQVSLQFDADGTKLFADMTKRDIGKQIAIFLDGQPISTPVVQAQIPDGQAVITGDFTVPDAKLLAQRLEAGALPVPIKLISQQTVGPTLGQDSITQSLEAGLWGFLLVAIFMLVIYRLPGLISIVALLLYAGISGALFKLIPVTLTLSGIAGFILSLGIAVDANVLVYERMKEELREGKALPVALENAFRRAWPSIRDGHVTVLISCAVLYWFSSSVIKGFALTLAIGTIISLFTAIVTCRTMLRAMATTGLSKFGWAWLKPPTKREPSS